jgi:hypothetical protein
MSHAAASLARRSRGTARRSGRREPNRIPRAGGGLGLAARSASLAALARRKVFRATAAGPLRALGAGGPSINSFKSRLPRKSSARKKREIAPRRNLQAVSI